MMQSRGQALNDAENLFYDQHLLDREALLKSLRFIEQKGADWADIYCQQTINRSWYLDRGQIKSGAFSIDRGVGIRSVFCYTSTLAYSNDIDAPTLMRLSDTVAGASCCAGSLKPIRRRVADRFSTPPSTAFYPDIHVFGDDAAEKAQTIVRQVDALARSADARVSNVLASIHLESDLFLLARMDRQLCADSRPLIFLTFTLQVEENGKREQAQAGGGSREGLAFFTEDRLKGWINEALGEALQNLHAQATPAGVLPVVLSAGWPGIMLHEAVGHGLEGDFIRKGTSAFTDKLGRRVASPGVTVVDDGTLARARGSLSIDDEGTPGGRTTLIEDGILTNFLCDLTTARALGRAPTGNGRRESFATLPLPRMTNTFMLAGQYSPDDIIASVDYGIYAERFGDGQVDITNGNFVFSMSQARLIEKGRLTRPVKGATLIGSGPSALRHIPFVGNDFALDSGVGQCGKDSQNVPVGVGMPTVRIDALTVGGTVNENR